MKISRQEIAGYAAMMQKVQRDAGRRARAAVRQWLASHEDWEAADLRNATIAIVQKVVDEYGGAVSSLACDLYDGTMMERGFERAVPWDGDFDDAVRRAVKYQLRKALDGDVDAFLDAVDDMAQAYVRKHANETTMANCERDNRAYGEGWLSDDRENAAHGALHQPLDVFGMPDGGAAAYRSNFRRKSYGGALRDGEPAFARVPTGAETCTYCLMLASRGFAYRSRESAGHADHRGCNCLIVAGCHGDAVEGVDEGAMYDCWRELEAVEAYAAKHPEEMPPSELERRKREIVDGYGDSIMVDSSPGAVRKLVKSNPAMGWYEPRRQMAANYRND